MDYSITNSTVAGKSHMVAFLAKALQIAIYMLLYQTAILASAMEASS